jgi:hypothetical protein
MNSYISTPTGGETPGKPDGGFFMTPRQAGILGASVVIALSAGWLTYLNTHGLGWAALACGTAFAGAVRFLDWFVGH